VLHTGIVDEIARREIIGAVDDEVARLDETLDSRIVDVDYVRLDFDFGIDFAQVIGSGDGLRQTLFGVTFREHRLPLEIGRLDEIAIHDAQVAHTRTRQRFSMGRTQRAATDNQYSCGKQPSLPFFANSTEENLSTVTIVHCPSV
jgi:hypothetical protein